MRLHAGGPGSAVERGIFTEHLAGSQIAEAHGLAGERIDGDPDASRGDEEDVVGTVKVIDDRLSGRIGAPSTTLLDLLDGIGRETREDGDPLQRVTPLLSLRLRHGSPDASS